MMPPTPPPKIDPPPIGNIFYYRSQITELIIKSCLIAKLYHICALHTNVQ